MKYQFDRIRLTQEECRYFQREYERFRTILYSGMKDRLEVYPIDNGELPYKGVNA